VSGLFAQPQADQGLLQHLQVRLALPHVQLPRWVQLRHGAPQVLLLLMLWLVLAGLRQGRHRRCVARLQLLSRQLLQLLLRLRAQHRQAGRCCGAARVGARLAGTQQLVSCCKGLQGVPGRQDAFQRAKPATRE
jgi:hypothetical protein